ncbi:MAG: glycosyltransferase family 39 protein [Pseudohongiellaceae bacterium]
MATLNDSQSLTYPLGKFFAVGLGALFLIKLYLAAKLDLYSDEIFYWQASTHLALGYSDLPFVSASLAGLGSAIAPHSALAVRSLFLVLGTCLPLLVFWISQPITGSRRAMESALLCLCLPLGASLGLLAVPDVPIIFFGLLAVGFFERAVRVDHLRYWVATGCMVALGFCTHYRFILYPAAVILFLILSQEHHYLWKKAGFWVAIAIALTGIIPIVWFNLTYQFSSANFYFADRHPWQFQSEGFLHIFEQALVVTPALYFVFGLTILYVVKLRHAGEYRATLFLTLALVHLLVYMVLAPWSDSDSTALHWPLSGYFMLLVFVPDCLRQCHSWIGSKWRHTTALRLVLAVPVMGFLGTLAGLAGIGSQAFQAQLQPFVGPNVLSNKMAGWQLFSKSYDDIVARHFEQADVIAITDNYYTAAQLEFANRATRTYNFDSRKAVDNGRAAQYRIWEQDETALVKDAGETAIFITEDSTLTVPDKSQLVGLACSYLENLVFLDQLWLFDGEKRFSFYKGEKIRAQQTQEFSSCPYPSQGWLHTPEQGDVLTEAVLFTGWVFNEGVGVEELYLLVDGQRFAKLDYGVSRPDVVEVMQVQSDPNRPNLGFDYLLDTTAFENGSVVVSLEIINSVGERQITGTREVTINNPSRF